MSDTENAMSSSIIPTMRYHNANEAIDWLCDVLGFQRQLVVPGPDATIAHAQLRLGTGMIMLGSDTNSADSDYGRLIKQPRSIGGVETQSPYVVVPNADAVYAKATAAGWKILIDIKDEDYGGRGFTCADPEGHIWNVGTYDPWAEHPAK